ncbi:MAG: glycosyltransferase [Candidatus Bathyarchaeia archaeon]|nr:glycosyltransferase [Candidatus Bathyarchaeia archaeon]
MSYSNAPSSRLIYIAKSLKKKGFDIELLGIRGEKITNLKTTTVTGRKNLARLKLLFLVLKKMLTENSNHVIIRGVHLAFFLLPLKIFRKKIFIDFHGWNFREIKLYYEKTLYNAFKILFYYFIERTATKHSDLIICRSKGLKTLLTKEEKRKSIILENGLDLAEAEKALQEAEKNNEKLLERYSIPKTKTLVAFLGFWGINIDMETMLEGCKKAEVNLIVVGEGPNIEKYRTKYGNTIFTGKLPRAEALRLISISDVAITAYKENREKHEPAYHSARKVKDYLSLGKPILIAGVQGREDFLAPYENAVFCRQNDPEDLATKIKMLISDEELRKRMRENNLKLARQFDWQVLVEKSGLIEKLSSEL